MDTSYRGAHPPVEQKNILNVASNQRKLCGYASKQEGYRESIRCKSAHEHLFTGTYFLERKSED